MTPSSGGTSSLSYFPFSPTRTEFTLRRAPDPRAFSLGILQILDPSIASFSLSAIQRRTIENRCGEDFLPRLRSLSEERDPRIYFASLQRLALGLEERDRLEPALAIDSILQQSLQNHVGRGRARRDETALALRATAFESAARGSAILGRGRVLPRLEFLGRRLAASSLDLPSLLAMGVANFVGRGMNWALLGILNSAGSRSLGVALASRGFALGLSLSAEAFSYTAVHRASGALLGREFDWSEAALRRDLSSSALTLFSLHLVSRFGNWGARVSPHRFIPSAVQRLLPEISLGLSVYLTHRLEERLGFREPGASWELDAVEAISTWFQFKIASRLIAPTLERAWRSLPSFEGIRMGSMRSLSRRILLAPLWMMMGANGGGGDFFDGEGPRQLGLFSERKEPPSTHLSDYLTQIEREGADSEDLLILSRLRAQASVEFSNLRELTQENQGRDAWQARLDRLLRLGLVREFPLVFSQDLQRRGFNLSPLGERIVQLFDRVESRLRVPYFSVRILDLLYRHRSLGETRLNDELRAAKFSPQQLESIPEALENLRKRGMVERVRVPRQSWGSERPKGIFRITELGGMFMRNWRARSEGLRGIRESFPG